MLVEKLFKINRFCILDDDAQVLEASQCVLLGVQHLLGGLLHVPVRLLGEHPAAATATATATAAATIQPAPAAPPAPGAPGLLGRQRLDWGEEERGASPGAENAAGAQHGLPRGRGRLAATGPGAAAALHLVGAIHDHQAIERIAVHSHSTGSRAARRRGSRSCSAAGASSSRRSRLSPGGPAAVALRADWAA